MTHPERGRMYSLDELNDLAEQGDPWAMGKVDEWEQHFSNEYVGSMKDKCPDRNCEQFGEPVTICYGENGRILDVDHGGWGHGPVREAEEQRRAS
ncbi:antirestriction protein ArdA [Arthrobacter zhaoxinii]|uniref:antirestriction protein ArdA n=1 Tax=Arthrobacter zhaoxinii TaxID=2964616 RepID=UPI00210739B9|nr:antirestriction protein ArdA [Arthrobacter zhaoxinii]MCQ1999233.1 antirestriction protein ArdA [Arthrobacter zhaoxinii]